MKLILTPSNPRFTLVVVDVETRQITPIPACAGQAPPLASHYGLLTRHRPFGITWNGGVLYVANRTNLLGFDRNLSYTGVLYGGLEPNPHQLLFSHGALHVASPWTGGIAVHDGERLDEVRIFHPSTGVFETGPGRIGRQFDKHHYNSLLIHSGKLYILSHNRGERPSEVLTFRYPDYKFMGSSGPLGYCSHNLCVEEEGIATLDTDGSGGLLRSDGDFIPLVEGRGEFLRGLAATDDYYFAGVSRRTERIYRGSANGSIKIVCRRKRRVIDAIPLEGLGAINDLRLLDVYDHAHGVTPFWTETSNQ